MKLFLIQTSIICISLLNVSRIRMRTRIEYQSQAHTTCLYDISSALDLALSSPSVYTACSLGFTVMSLLFKCYYKTPKWLYANSIQTEIIFVTIVRYTYKGIGLLPLRYDFRTNGVRSAHATLSLSAFIFSFDNIILSKFKSCNIYFI